MPTAVEHGFLKLDGFGDRDEQHKLSEAFLKIDSAFLKLEGADTTSAFLKLEASPAIKYEFETIGGAFDKLGDVVGDTANVALKIDDFVIKLTNAGSVTLDAVTTGGGVDPQSDFLKVDAALTTSAADLKLFGEDFLKLDQSASVSDFWLKVDAVGSDLGTLGSDMTADENAFDQLGEDFIKLGGGAAAAASDPIIDTFYKELGADLYKIGSDFGSLSSDFLKLELVMTAGGGVTVGSAVELLSASSGGGMGPIGSSFAALDQDFLKLDNALGAAGGPAAAVIGDFIHKLFGGGGGGAA